MELDSHHGPNFIAQADQAAPIGSGCSDNRRSGNPRPIESHWRQFQFGAARLAVDRPSGPGHKEVDSLTDSMRKIGVRRREHSDKPSPSHHILRGFVHGSQWILVPQCDSGRPKRYSSTLVQAPMGLFADALVRPSERLDQRLYTDRRTDRDDPCRWVAAAHGSAPNGVVVHATGTLVIRISRTRSGRALTFTETGLAAAEHALGFTSPFGARGQPTSVPVKRVHKFGSC